MSMSMSLAGPTDNVLNRHSAHFMVGRKRKKKTKLCVGRFDGRYGERKVAQQAGK